METNIRFAAEVDIETLISLRFDYFANEKHKITAETRAFMETNLRQYFAEHINRDFFAAIVEADEKIVATAFLAVSAKPANLSFPTGKTGTILNVLTYPEHRRKGYAESSLKLFLEEARRQNLSYIELSASEMGKPLYQKLGFREKVPSDFTEMRLSLL